MKIVWHCEKCGSGGSSENKSLKPQSVNDGRLARMLHDSISPNCHPEPSDIYVRIYGGASHDA